MLWTAHPPACERHRCGCGLLRCVVADWHFASFVVAYHFWSRTVHSGHSAPGPNGLPVRQSGVHRHRVDRVTAQRLVVTCPRRNEIECLLADRINSIHRQAHQGPPSDVIGSQAAAGQTNYSGQKNSFQECDFGCGLDDVVATAVRLAPCASHTLPNWISGKQQNEKSLGNGAPEEIRTPDPQIRSLVPLVIKRADKQCYDLFNRFF